jgi:CubicO group peptidase (beta-lactamase class C family)
VGYLNGEDGTIDTETPAREHVGRGYKIPNGGIYSTVGDLARFAAALSGKTSGMILGSEGRSLLVADQTPAGSANAYSFGFRLWDGPGGSTLVGHGGSVAGYNAFLVFEPQSGVAVILLRNYNEGETDLSSAGLGLLREMLTCESR